MKIDTTPDTTDTPVTTAPKDIKLLKRAAKKALKRAITETVPAGSDMSTLGPSIAEAFAKTFAPMMETFTSGMKLTTERVIEKTGRTSNDHLSWPAISYLNPRGDRDFPRPNHFTGTNGKPRDVFFCGGEQTPLIMQHTVDEIAAYDAFGTDGETHYECRNGTWKADIIRNGNREGLWIMLPKNDHDKVHHLPGLIDILYELRTKGKRYPDANAILTKMLAKQTDPEAFIKNLEKLLGVQETVSPVGASA